MSYQGITDLSRNVQFLSRLWGALIEQAKQKYDPAAPSVESWLAAAVLKAPDYWTNNWSGTMAAQPTFAQVFEDSGVDAISDAMILASVQALWPTMGSLYESVLNPAIEG